MVYFMENPIKMDDLGGFTPIFGGHPYIWSQTKLFTETERGRELGQLILALKEVHWEDLATASLGSKTK